MNARLLSQSVNDFNDAPDHNMICLFAQTWIKLVDVAFEV